MSLVGVGLAAARVWAALAVQPSWLTLLGRRWLVIAAALALGLGVLVFDSAGPSPVPSEGPALVLALVAELGLGLGLGLAAALPGWALVGAADSGGDGLGLRGPASLGPLLVAAALAGALALGAHRPLLAALAASFEAFALAQPSAWTVDSDLGPWLADRSRDAAALGLALATPVLLTRALTELCVGSFARLGPEQAAVVAALGPGLRLAAGLIALGAAWAAYPEAFARGL